MRKIVLGGGCFWCIEAVFQKIKGVKKVESGYAGGNVVAPTYEQVCSGRTGHAEVVLVEYDENEINLETILKVFFAAHDPTTLNRQGHDVGEQYRSVIFWTEPEQEETVKAYLQKIKNDFSRPVVTDVKKLDAFYPAEEYHLDYFSRNPRQPYCQMVISPKVRKIEKDFQDLLK